MTVPRVAESPVVNLGEGIRQALGGRLTQEQLADKLGVDQGQVSRWVRDKATPSVTRLFAIEDAAGRPRGFIMRAAGYLTDEPTVEEVLEADPAISDDAREMLKGMYAVAVRQHRAHLAPSR